MSPQTTLSQRAMYTLPVTLVVLWLGYAATAQPPGQRPVRHPLSIAIDADGNGVISAAELEKAAQALKRLDRNQDGQLTPDELRPATGGDRPRRAARRGPPASADAEVATIDSSPLPSDDAEKKILSVLEEMDQNQRQGMMNVPADDGRLLRLLTEAVGARRVVEIGTSNGYSGIWFCLALRKTGGQLITHELDGRRAALARENFQTAGVGDLVTLVEGDAHETVKQLQEPIDILFIDADKPGYADYLEKLLPLVRPGGLIVGHNMHRPAPSPEYITAITTNPVLESLFLNMHAAGIAVTLKKR